MRPAAIAFVATGFIASAVAAMVVANFAVAKLEQTTGRQSKTALVASGQNWANVTTDGMMVILGGTAPDEQKRLQAFDAIAAVVSTRRIHNLTGVAESVPAIAPDFALEILRNDQDISLIGITPRIGADDPLHREITAISGATLIDMLETTDWPAPDGWQNAVAFGARIMADMEQAKVSIQPGKVHLKAVVRNAEEKIALMLEMIGERPEDVEFTMDITAPRPIFSPYRLGFTLSGDAATLTCQALTPAGSRKIVSAARAFGIPEATRCQIGLGAPTDDWADVVIHAIQAVGEMGGGALEMQDSSITLISPEEFDPARFEAIAGSLQDLLPDAYILHRVLTKKPSPIEDNIRPWFTAKRPAEGAVVLRGVSIDALSKETLAAYSAARFGLDGAEDKTEIAAFAPHGWTLRQLVALDVLDMLNEGEVSVTEDEVRVRGKGAVVNLGAEIKARLEQGFGADARFDIDVQELTPAPVEPEFPDPTVCEGRISELLAENQILFAPSSAIIKPDSQETLTLIAGILHECRNVWFEIGGYTDSQGREQMNKNLSQSRADAVLDALLVRNLLLGDLTAVGYGEANPIGDNETEEGRLENRRIEFRLREGNPGDAQDPSGATAPPEAQPDTPARRPEELKILAPSGASEETNG